MLVNKRILQIFHVAPFNQYSCSTRVWLMPAWSVSRCSALFSHVWCCFALFYLVLGIRLRPGLCSIFALPTLLDLLLNVNNVSKSVWVAGPPGFEPGTPGFLREALRLKVRCSGPYWATGPSRSYVWGLNLRAGCFLVFRCQIFNKRHLQSHGYQRTDDRQCCLFEIDVLYGDLTSGFALFSALERVWTCWFWSLVFLISRIYPLT